MSLFLKHNRCFKENCIFNKEGRCLCYKKELKTDKQNDCLSYIPLIANTNKILEAFNYQIYESFPTRFIRNYAKKGTIKSARIIEVYKDFFLIEYLLRGNTLRTTLTGFDLVNEELNFRNREFKKEKRDS